ncbi:hypothetical protein, partial [Salmonella enterica]
MVVLADIKIDDVESEHTEIKKKKRVQGGEATSNVTMSAHLSGNAEVFPQILDLHVPEGAVIADVTFGGGVFWKKVNLDKYKL